jgi:dihydroxyacetone kinase DhaKLM complex PTS-EIIA-like component DhaM
MLAEGVRELARQMADSRVLIGAAGGIQDEWGDEVLGTDALEIARLVRSCADCDDVLLLVDMGSAVFAAEQALDLLPPDIRARCLISNAPLVEGAIVAAVEASLGRDLRTVNSAAEAAGTMAKR